jgi:RsiW-degrading membrane proteinase PrsW (M82 family)/ribosomal protein L37E
MTAVWPSSGGDYFATAPAPRPVAAPPPPPPPPPPPLAPAPSYRPPPPQAFQPPPQAPTGHQFCRRCGSPGLGLHFCAQCGLPVPPSPPQPAWAGQLQLKELLPLGDWWRYGVWRDRRLLAFVGIALVPFLLLQLTVQSAGDLGPAAWGFSIYFAVLWSVGIRMLLRPERVSVGLHAQVIGITAVLGIGAALLLESNLNSNADTLVRSIATIGFPEEFGKALPLLLVLWRLGARCRPGTYLYLGVVSGLTFGAVEAVEYTALYTDPSEGGSDPSVVVGVIWRLLTDSLFHGAMAGICAMFFGLAALQVRHRWVLIGLGLTFAAVLHGAYDRFADQPGGMLIAGVTVVLFAGYVRSSEEIAKRLWS